MTVYRWTLLSVVTIAVALTACANGGAASANDASKGDEVVAKVDGKPITQSELEDEIGSRLHELRQQEYDLRTNGIRGIVFERLVDRRAKEEGITRDELLEREIRAMATEPTDQEIEAVYNQYKDQPALQGKSLEEAKPLILPQLQRQKLQQAQMQYFEQVLADADIQILVEPPRYDVKIPDGEPSKGNDDAPVTLVEFSDFQCGYCKRAHPMVTKLLDEYGDQVRFVYRDYGIPNHTRAKPAAEAARCAGDQDRYWDYFANLMENSGSLDDADLAQRATDLGLDMEKFNACLESDRHVEAIDESFEAAEKLGVRGTPTFFINGRILVGAKPIEEFRDIIDEEIARSKPS
jgi:protein-disulfide isomerase